MTSQPVGSADVAAANDPRVIARFGAFELDTSAGELRRDGIRIKVQDQPLRLLVLLVQNAGEIITRERLQHDLWPEAFVEFDQSLNAAIRKLRAALGDDAENPRFIETLARKGYRFITPVTWPVTAATAPPAKKRPYWMIGIAIAVIAIGIGTFLYRRQTKIPWFNVVAVLPFTVDDKANEQLADGLTETLIDDVSNLSNLRVIARTTAFRYKGATDVQRVARDLKVEGIITGTVRHTRDQYSIRVELIDAADGTHVWGDEFRARDQDLPALHGEIARAIAFRLKRGMNDAAPGTTNAAAYDLYIRGLYEWNHRDPESLARALDLFNRAIVADPTFARAYAGVAQVYGVMVGYGQIAPDVGTPKILAAAQRALELDPNNAEALTSIATTKYRNLWDFPGAERDYRHALASNPNYATAHQWYADYLRSVGRHAEGRRENELAYKLDPFAPAMSTMLCYAMFYDHEYDKAIDVFRSHGNGPPNMKFVETCVVRCLFAKGDTDGAIREIDNSRLEAPIKAALVGAYHRDGMRGYLQALLDWMLHQPEPENARPVEIAGLYASLGNKDKAFEWLETAYRRRISRVTSITYEPEFESLHEDPRFVDLVRRIGLPLPSAGKP
jgi:TolB-like protein/DNA-binding winged helix-turn-helix (wHTH) protein